MYTLEVCEEQIDKIVVDELKTSIEMALLNDVSSFEDDRTDYELLSHLFPVLQYFSTQKEFADFVELTERNFPDFSYSDLVSKTW